MYIFNIYGCTGTGTSRAALSRNDAVAAIRKNGINDPNKTTKKLKQKKSFFEKCRLGAGRRVAVNRKGRMPPG
jgi:hypothetical protein